MDAPSTTPHDALYKQYLMHAETARVFLEIHLPVELRELCDLNTLHLESGSFIEESLKGHSTDVLYSVQMQGSGDGSRLSGDTFASGITRTL